MDKEEKGWKKLKDEERVEGIGGFFGERFVDVFVFYEVGSDLDFVAFC